MKISNVGANQTEVAIDNYGIILVSYDTPVAIVYCQHGTIKSANVDGNKWSKTTNKHITKFLARHNIPGNWVSYHGDTSRRLQIIIDNGGLIG